MKGGKNTKEDPCSRKAISREGEEDGNKEETTTTCGPGHEALTLVTHSETVVKNDAATTTAISAAEEAKETGTRLSSSVVEVGVPIMDSTIISMIVDDDTAAGPAPADKEMTQMMMSSEEEKKVKAASDLHTPPPPPPPRSVGSVTAGGGVASAASVSIGGGGGGDHDSTFTGPALGASPASGGCPGDSEDVPVDDTATLRRSIRWEVGAHSIVGPGFATSTEDGVMIDSTTDASINTATGAAAAAPSLLEAGGIPSSLGDHDILIEATLVDGSSGGGGSHDVVEDDVEGGRLPTTDRRMLETQASQSGGLSVISTLTTPHDDDCIVEATPVKHTFIKRFLLLLLLVIALVATVVAITASLNNNNNNQDNSKSTTADDGGTNNNKVPLSPEIDDPAGPETTTATAAADASSTADPEEEDQAVPWPPNPTLSPSTLAPLQPTLQRIRTEGVLRCGLSLEIFTDLFANVKGKENSFDADICRAIAAGVMGRDHYRVDLVPLHYSDRVHALESGRVDILVAALSWTMDRDVYVPDYQRGIGFSSVYTTLSSGFGGNPEYVACAQNGMKYLDECAGMKLCTLNGTRFYDNLSNHVPRGMIKRVERFEDFFPAFEDGTCNVFASTFVNLNFLTKTSAQAGMYFASGQGYYSSEPLSLTARKEDRQWMDFCNYIMLSLFAAEYHNITSDNVLSINSSNNDNDGDQFRQPKFQRPTGFGPEYENMFIDALMTSGNYGEMEANRINPMMLQREPINAVNDGTVGIIHSLPFGNTRVEGPSLDEKFQEIVDREKLRCAIKTSNRPGFAAAQRMSDGTEESSASRRQQESFSGMDVDYCLAIAASIFSPFNTVEFFEVQDDAEGFELLHKDEVDVFAGVMVDMERDVMDPATGVGFSFTTPYFYNSSADGNQRGPDANLCLATREDYTGWSEYVFWIVQATFYAEEEGITRFTANDMPMVDLYGERFTRIFRDAISAVGSYGEIYERNVQDHIPRQGLNMLHDKSNPGPLIYIPPGIFQSS